jgi:tetratricopeptide (TPR) repeat protein
MTSKISNLNCYLRLSRRWLAVPAIVFAFLPGANAQQQSDQNAEVQRLMSVAKSAEANGHYDDAILSYRQIVALSKEAAPQDAALAYFDAGLIYLKFKKYEEAVNAFRLSLKLDSNSAEANNNLGEALSYLKRYPEAVAAFQAAVALDRNLLIAQFNTGLTYTRMGQFNYAEFVFRILIRDHPDYAFGYDGLAVTLAKSGRAREAIAFHEKAIGLSPETPFFYYNLGISYLVLGNTEKAVEQKEKLQQLDPLSASKLSAFITQRQK